jgi:hypothetical protein
MKCECGLNFNTTPRGIIKYEDHLPCPARGECKVHNYGWFDSECTCND